MQAKAINSRRNKKPNIFKYILSIRGIGQVISVTIALIIMCLVFSQINDNFSSGNNALNLLRQIAPILIIGIGQSCVLITGGIDLSIGSVAGMSCMVSATLMTKFDMNPAIAAILTMICCIVIGVLNGFLVSKTKLPAFIATLGTMIIARGIAQLVNGNRNTDGISSSIFKDLFYYEKTAGIYNTIWISLILFLIFAFMLAKTCAGRHTYAIGSNYEAAKLSGVNVVLAEMRVYIFSAFLSGVVGLILTAQSGMGTMDAGNGYELNAVAASVIGGVSTMGGQGLLVGTVIGSCIWGVLENGLTFAGAPLAIRNIVIGIVVIISVLIDRIARGNIGGVKKLFKGNQKTDRNIKKQQTEGGKIS